MSVRALSATGSGVDELWTWDSGASRVTRDKENHDDSSKNRKVIVELAANQVMTGAIDPAGECILSGKLLPTGRAVRIGRWTNCWTPDGGPIIAQLNSKQQKAVQDIVLSAPHMVPKVEADIPYLTDSQARVIRDSIALNKCAPMQWSGKLVAHLLRKRHAAKDSIPLLGKLDIKFCKWMKDHPESVDILRTAVVSDPLCISEVQKAWSTHENSERFCNFVHSLQTPEGGEDESMSVPCCEVLTSQEGQKVPCCTVISGGQVQHQEGLEEPTARVSFGENEYVHFTIDGSPVVYSKGDSLLAKMVRKKIDGYRQILHRSMKKPEIKMSEMDIHNLTHLPARADCEVCRRTKKSHSPCVSGSATTWESVSTDTLITIDWLNPSLVSSNGSRFVAVVTDDRTGAIYTKAYKEKKNNSVNALNCARLAWKIENQSYTLHSDNEGVLKDQQMVTYMDLSHGVPLRGVQRRSNTNSKGERSVRTATEGTRAMIYQSGLPTKQWHFAVNSFGTYHANKCGVPLRFSTARLPPYGCLGKALLPRGLLFNDNWETRTKHIINLGPAEDTSGGVKILFKGAEGSLRRGVVLDRDVEWFPSVFPAERTRKCLDDVCQLCPEVTPLNPVQSQQACCDLCHKWRFVSEEMVRKLEDGPFFCRLVDLNCEVEEDPRANLEVEDEEIVETPSGDLVFAPEVDEDEEEFKIKAQRCRDVKEITDSCAVAPEVRRIVDGDSEACSEEMRSALLRLGAKKCTLKDIKDMEELVTRESRAEKSESIRAFAIVIRNKDAMKDSNPERPKWVESMDTELGALLDTNVVALSSLSEVREGDEILPTVLILTKKPCGRFKSRICACGNYQEASSNDCYAGVVSREAWMSHVFLGLSQGLSVAQIDITTAFLQSEKENESPDAKQTFLRIPREVKAIRGSQVHGHQLFKLLKGIYGLRTAPRQWKVTLEKYLSTQGYRQSKLDDTCWINEAKNVRILLYVDDLIVIGNRAEAELFLSGLQSRFSCTPPKWLDEATEADPLLFLGHQLWLSEVAGTRHFNVSQTDYVHLMLQRYEMLECRPLVGLDADEFTNEYLFAGELLSPEELTKLRGIIGAVSYLALGSRIDLLAAVSILGEGQAKGTTRHLEVAKKMIRFIAGTRDRYLSLPCVQVQKGEKVNLHMEFDANYGMEKARSGAIMFINGAPVSWFSRRQKAVVLSTCEAELCAATAGGRELQGARNSLAESWPELEFVISMSGDNRAANLIASKQSSLRKVRHLCLADLWIRDLCASENMQIMYTPSTSNGSDMLTKVLSKNKLFPLLPHVCLRSKME